MEAVRCDYQAEVTFTQSYNGLKLSIIILLMKVYHLVIFNLHFFN